MKLHYVVLGGLLTLTVPLSSASAGAKDGPVDWENTAATDRWILFEGGKEGKIVIYGYVDEFTAKVVDADGREMVAGVSDPKERRIELRWTPRKDGWFKVVTDGSGILRLITN